MKKIRQMFVGATVTASLLLIAYVSILVGASFFPRVVMADREVVKEVLDGIPMLERICQAESGGRQFLKSGAVVRGIVNPSDIGICQINEPIWNDKARELGFDIYTEAGNKSMARWIFLRYGAQPWNSSKHVWSK